MKEKFFKNIKILFLVIYSIFSIGLLVAPLKYTHSIKFIILYIIIFSLFIIFIKLKNIINNLLHKKNITKIIFISVIFIGILIRVLLLCVNYSELTGVGDYQTFFSNSATFCESNNIFQKTYVELFPFLIPYMVLLGSFFKIASISYKSVVLLNIILDLLTALFLYFSFNNKNIKMILPCLWLLNPINCIWCTICCPVVAVNFGIVLSIFAFSKVLKHINSKLFILYSIITGVIMGFANMFRPIMPIMLIAILLYYIFINLKQKNLNVNYIVSFLLITISFLCVKSFGTFTFNKIINGNVSTTSGWTLYIGSNLESNGMWYPEKKLDEFLSTGLSPEETQQKFKGLAIERYKNNGINNVKLFKNKFFVLTEQTAEYSFKTFLSIYQPINLIAQVIRLSLYLFIFLLVLLNALNVYLDIKYKNSDIQDLFYMLLYIGLVMAHLFVEVSPRYYMPAIVPLTIISGLSLYKFLTITEKGEIKND